MENLQNLIRIDENGVEPVIKEFDILKQNIIEYLDIAKHNELVISNKDDLKLLKETRTEIRKQKEGVKLTRQLIENQYIKTISGQCKEIEKLLDEADKELKLKIDTYETEVIGKVDKEKLSYLTVKSTDVSKLKLVQDFAKRLGLEAIIKGE